MRIGLIYDVLRHEERMLLDAVRRLGHEAHLIHVSRRIDWIHNMPDEVDELGFALERCVSHYRALASALILKEKGLNVVNSYEVIRDSGDKLVTTIKLAKRGIPVPKTAIAYSREKVLEAAKKLGYPVVIKPIIGSWGRMIARASNEDDLLDLLDFRESMNSPHFKIHYVQEYVEKPGRDIRAFYVWGEVPAAIYRVNERWKTNTALGGRAVAAELGQEVVELVMKAGEAMGDGILGIDLLETKDRGVYVNEINAVTEFRNTVIATGYDLAGKMIRETVEVFRR